MEPLPRRGPSVGNMSPSLQRRRTLFERASDRGGRLIILLIFLPSYRKGDILTFEAPNPKVFNPCAVHSLWRITESRSNWACLELVNYLG